MATRNRFLDIVKCIAIIMVIISHYGFSNEEKLQYLFPYWANMAVPIFMVVTGYFIAASYNKKSLTTLKEVYAPAPIAKKLVRYILPFICMFAAELLIETLHMNQPNVEDTLTYLVSGGIGVHGTYYVPILIQLVFLAPLIFWVVRKWKYGIVYCFIFNFAFEYIKTQAKMNLDDYRLCALRYVFAVAIGCFIFLHYRRDAKWNWIWIHMCEIGAFYLWMVGYASYNERFFIDWKTTSMMSILFIAPILAYAIDRCSHWHFKPAELIGKASYHIFLFQIIYFNYFSDKFRRIVPGTFLEILTDIAICVVFGLAFYFFCNGAAKFYKILTVGSTPKKAE